jgi:CRISPR/Cas system CMR subunit Cmr6 (Cas7 group RAMP superfamily)
MHCPFLSSKGNCKLSKTKPLSKCSLRVLLQKNGEISRKEKVVKFLECYSEVLKEKGEEGYIFFENISEIFKFNINLPKRFEPLSLFEAQTLLKTLKDENSGLRYQTRVPKRLEKFMKIINIINQ